MIKLLDTESVLTQVTQKVHDGKTLDRVKEELCLAMTRHFFDKEKMALLHFVATTKKFGPEINEGAQRLIKTIEDAFPDSPSCKKCWDLPVIEVLG